MFLWYIDHKMEHATKLMMITKNVAKVDHLTVREACELYNFSKII